MLQRRITIFGGSRCAESAPEYQDALRLGKLLAHEGYAVCTGGYYGIMGAISRGAHEAGGEVIGVTMNSLKAEPNPYLKQILPTEDFYNRLQHLIRDSDAFIAMRGGMGTVTEISLVWNKLVTHIIDPPKPLILVGDCWRRVADAWKTNLPVSVDDLSFVTFAGTPEEALDELRNHFARSSLQARHS